MSPKKPNFDINLLQDAAYNLERAHEEFTEGDNFFGHNFMEEYRKKKK